MMNSNPSPNKQIKPVCIGGIGEKNFGNQYRQGNRIYDARYIAVALTASPVGGIAGQSSLYLVQGVPNGKNISNCSK